MSTVATPKTAADLARVTGLTEGAAKACFDKFGGYAPALASFAQSIKNIPREMIADSAKHTGEGAKEINNELRQIYEHVRGVREALKCSDKEAWSEFYKTTTVPKAAAAPAVAPPQKPAFGFGTAPTAAPIAFGFGKAAPSASTAAAPAPAAGFGFGTSSSSSTAATAAPAASEEPAHEGEAKPVPKYVNQPKHFTGPLLEMPHFWEKEVIARAALFNLDCGFLEKNRDQIAGRLQKWLHGCDFFIKNPVQYVAMEDKDEHFARVMIKDAERTFFAEEHREKFYMFLYAMYFEFGNYGQAMSYLAGLCLLGLNEQQTAAVLRKVNKTYIPGHWAAEAIGFATSAWVVEHFIKKHFPDVAEHFAKLNFWPDTYLQKILSGLCVHVLRFEDLFEFLDEFMEHGFQYLLRFSLSIIEHFRLHLLSITAPEKMNELFEIMRLDSKAVDRSDVKKILQRSKCFPIHEDASNIDVLRSQIYNDKVEPRIKRAPKTETFEPCEVCEKNKPIWWNDDLGAVCDACKAKNPDAEFSKY